MVRVKVGFGVIVMVIVIGLDLMCMLQLLCAFIQFCLKRSMCSQISRLRTCNGEYKKGYKSQRVRKFNNMIRMTTWVICVVTIRLIVKLCVIVSYCALHPW